jgi:3-methyladenine DNA glycosylase AlkD
MLKEIQTQLRKHSSPAGKASARKFVPGSRNVYGVRMPVLNDLAKKYKEGGFGLVEQLWRSGSYEERILSAKLLGKIAKKDPDKTMALIKSFSKDISDWAVCDTMGMQSPKPINKSHAKEIFQLANQLITSANFWQRRLALVLAEWYTRDASFHGQIRSLLQKVKDDDEYYVKKAVVWINRNFEKKR